MAMQYTHFSAMCNGDFVGLGVFVFSPDGNSQCNANGWERILIRTKEADSTVNITRAEWLAKDQKQR